MKLIASFEDTLDSTLRLHLRQNAVNGIEYGAIFDINGRYRYSYGVHGLLTIHELRSFCLIRAPLMSRGMTQLFAVAWDLR